MTSPIDPDWENTDVPFDESAEPEDADVQHLATPEEVGE